MNLLKATLLKVAADYVASPDVQQAWQQHRTQTATTPQLWESTGSGGVRKNPNYVSPYADENNRWKFEGRGLQGLGRDVANAAGQVGGTIYRGLAGTVAFPARVANSALGLLSDVNRNRDAYWNYWMKGDTRGARQQVYVDTPNWYSGYMPERSGYGFLHGNQGYWGQLGTGIEKGFTDFVEPFARLGASWSAPTLQSADQAQPNQGFWIDKDKAPAQHPWKAVSPGYYQNQNWTPESTQPYMMAAPQNKQGAAIATPQASTSPATPTEGIQGAEDLHAVSPMPATAQSSANAALTQGIDATRAGQGKAGSWVSDKLGDLASRRGWMQSSPLNLDFRPQLTADEAPAGEGRLDRYLINPLHRYLFDPGTAFGHQKGIVPSALQFKTWEPRVALGLVSRLLAPTVLATADKLKGAPSWKERWGAYSAPAFISQLGRQKGWTPDTDYRFSLDVARGRPSLDPSNPGRGLGATLENLGLGVKQDLGMPLQLLGNQWRKFRSSMQ